MKEVVVATKNQGKVAELKKALSGLPVKLLSLNDFPDIPEAVEDGDTFLDNALLKARHYLGLTGKACFADDSGLEVDALNGAPGVYSSRYAGEHAGDQANNNKLLAAMTGVPHDRRSARFRCVLVFCDVDGRHLSTAGDCEGMILEEMKGTGGFGYDPLFFLPALGKTIAELSMDEKNAVSHRGQAVRKITAELAGYFA